MAFVDSFVEEKRHSWKEFLDLFHEILPVFLNFREHFPEMGLFYFCHSLGNAEIIDSIEALEESVRHDAWICGGSDGF